MKRLSAVISSDSDNDENDLSKIKNQFKKSTKLHKKDISVKKIKVTEYDGKQMSLMTAFGNINAAKRTVESKLDTIVKMVPKLGLKIISPEDFFSTPKSVNKSIPQSNFETIYEPFVLETESKIKEALEGTESEIVINELNNIPSNISGNIKTLFTQFMKPNDSGVEDACIEDIHQKSETMASLPEFPKTTSLPKESNKPIIVNNHKEVFNESLIPASKIIVHNTPESTKLTAKPLIPLFEDKTNILPRSSLLVDKYAPKTLNKVIGQQSETSPANKLLLWLKNFDKNLALNFTSDHGGGRFRAALLSGPPGVGKTTTAKIVCKDLGYYVVELNASSVRSKNVLKSMISDSQSFYKYKDVKHCVIMDEVDGMAGNEDRGGINELIHIIKVTKYPIICICNDRQSRKLQSFVKHVYDLRYSQLTSVQVKSNLLSIAFKEKIKLPNDALDYIIKASNNDMRQVINNLQMWSAGSLDSDTLKNDAKNSQKEFKSSPFDVIIKVFSHQDVKTLSDKSDLFFQDYQLNGLFVHENYSLSVPYLAKGNMKKTMQLLSIAADSLATGDIISNKINITNDWSLLPTQAMFSSVIPGEYLHGRLRSRPEFPSWLGKFSKTNKNSRILTSLCSHLSLSTKGGVFQPHTISMDYGDVLVKRLVTPMKEGDIETVLFLLNKNQLVKEDMDLLIEATSWPHLPHPLSSVTSQIKASLTRAYNKSSFHLPYSLVSTKNVAKVNEITMDLDGNVEEDVVEDVVEDDEKENIETDAMISKTKSKPKQAAATKSRKPPPKKSDNLKIPKTKKVATKKN